MHKTKWLSLAGAAVLALGVGACGSDDDSGSDSASSSSGGDTAAQTTSGAEKLSGNIAGAGSSAQAAAQEAWTAGFQEGNPDATVAYDPVGSGGGREQFVAGGVDFAGSDAGLADDELTGAQKRCGGEDNLIEAPVYVSPIAVVYNLDGVEGLQLKPATIAKIFKGDIKTWNDPAIKADNPDADLPGDRITVVHRSDSSGTTENLTDYLSQTAGADWTYDVSGDWPLKGGEAAQGTSGVVDAVKNGKGTIGYADESQARELGIAKIAVGSGFEAPTAEGAAKVLEASEKAGDPGKFVFTYKVNRTVSDAGAYPIVLVSYFLACTKYDDAGKAGLVKGYLGYAASEEGQAKAAEAAGSAPLPASVRDAIAPAVDAIGAGA